MILISHRVISKCGNSRCKTCPILDTSGSFTSSLTNKSYCTQGFEDFNCKTSNLIYSHIRSLGAAGALAVDICICFHDTES